MTPPPRSAATAPPPPRGTSVRPEDLAGDDATRVGADPGPSLLSRALLTIRETVQLAVVALLMAFVIKTVALQAFYIPSESMLETLQVGDRVLVEKVTFRLRDPERGEVVVFRNPSAPDEGVTIAGTWRSFLEGVGLSEPDEDRDLIKRVIGLPGETVELIDGVVHIDGAPLTEPYAAAETRDFPPVVVAEGEFFVLGDNRGNSRDSRFGLGTIPQDNLIGRAFTIIWPPGDATFRLDQDYPGVGEGRG